MPTPYTGNPVGVHPPDPGAAPAQAPTIVIPDDLGDTGAYLQAFGTIADYFAYIQNYIQVNRPTVFQPPLFGDGSDGALNVIAGTPQALLGVVKNYTDLTIGPGGVLTSRRSIIRVSGTLTIDPAGLITGDGAKGGDGTGSNVGMVPPPAGQGTDGVGGSIITACPIGGSTTGGAGDTGILDDRTGVFSSASPAGLNPTTSGQDFANLTVDVTVARNVTDRYCGRSAIGGDAGYIGMPRSSIATNIGGAGCRNGTADDAISPDLLTAFIFNPGFVYRTRNFTSSSYASEWDPFGTYGGVDYGSFAEIVPLRGGSGGAGGTVGVPPPASFPIPDQIAYRTCGSGGAGADCIWIYANKVVLGSPGCITACGGKGGKGSNYYPPGYSGASSVAGGGGGGGRIGIFHGGILGTLSSAMVAGGAAGTGGPSGVSFNGGAGSLTIMKVA
jgi:hypothetical protein